MAANIEEKVIEKLRVLPEDQQAEVLKFVEDLAEVKLHPNKSLNRFFRWRGRCDCRGPADWSSRLDDYLYGRGDIG